MNKPKYYRVTRMKQARNVRYRVVFSWEEGDPHIHISFDGRYTPFDTIGVFNHATATCTIGTRTEFLNEVHQWLRAVHPDTLAAAWAYPTVGAK